jgi:hypothetical protein
MAEKPEKPPSSGYALFSEIMLNTDQIKQYPTGDRMKKIGRAWQCMSINNKKYNMRANHVSNASMLS